jgi:molecular chaperone HtpG
MEYRFQVNLGGIIDLLSNHTYSSPQVFVRELLQNCVDAITARTLREPEHRGVVEIELKRAVEELKHAREELARDGHAREGDGPELLFRDNGIGLTEDEVHLFLATIGQTSKRPELLLQPTSFIGQFGVGLLSCFMVSDEVVVVTRSAKDGGKTFEWRGRADGTYTLSVLDREAAPGTEVRLRCKPGGEEYFQPQTIARLAAHYGSLLPFPIIFSDGAAKTRVNEAPPPWKQTHADAELERDAYLEYGRATFGVDFFDYIPLRSPVGGVEGVAFVLPYSPSLSTRKTHLVYLKNMLLSEQAEGLLPDWAFFVKCVANADGLRPTASRESFYEDDKLAATRAALGQQLRQYLFDLARENPARLKRLIGLHFLSLKALAVEDEEFFALFVNWLPFETNMGTMTLTEYMREHEVVRYATDLDEFRQTARIAAAQSLCVVNAAYTYDERLMRQLARVFPHVPVWRVDGLSLTYSFEQLTLDEQDEVAGFVGLAGEVLSPFRCDVEIKNFSPGELPALHIAGGDAQLRRSIESAKEVTGAFWSSVLEDVGASSDEEARSQLCFNYRNPVVRKVARMRDRELLRLSVEMLYVQAVLLSHRPLDSKEMALLNEGLVRFIEWGADALEGWVQ